MAETKERLAPIRRTDEQKRDLNAAENGLIDARREGKGKVDAENETYATARQLLLDEKATVCQPIDAKIAALDNEHETRLTEYNGMVADAEDKLREVRERVSREIEKARAELEERKANVTVTSKGEVLDSEDEGHQPALLDPPPAPFNPVTHNAANEETD